MADKVIFEVVAEGKNIKVIQKQTGKLADEVERTNTARDKATKAGSKYNKQEKAIYQTGLSSAKGFSKMNQTIGSGSSGLVGAYATLAANVFAATAAFGALRSAAQLEQLAAGLEEVGTRGGRNLSGIADNLREITGLAISTEDSMRAVAIGISAGFSTGQMEQLTTVAKGASLALGRDMGDAMNRLIRGAAKLEPEILDELGIMVRLDQATSEYASTVGKSVESLTQYERRMAFINAINQEGLEKFGDIANAIDPNPYDRLAASLADLVKVGTTVLNKFLGPLVNVLSKSLPAMAGGVVLFASTISKQMLPSLYGASAAAASAADDALKLSQANLTALKTTGAFPATYNKYIASVKDGSATIEEADAMQKELTHSIDTHQRHIDKYTKGARDPGDKEQIGISSDEDLAVKKGKVGELRVAQDHLTASTQAQLKADAASQKSMALGNAKIGTLKLGWSQLSVAKTLNTQAIVTNIKGQKLHRRAMMRTQVAAIKFGMSMKFVGTAIMSAIPFIGMFIMAAGLLWEAWKKWGPQASAFEKAAGKVGEAGSAISRSQEKLQMNIAMTDDKIKQTILTYNAYAGAVQTATDAIAKMGQAHIEEQIQAVAEMEQTLINAQKKLDALKGMSEETFAGGAKERVGEDWTFMGPDAAKEVSSMEEVDAAIVKTTAQMETLRAEMNATRAAADKIGDAVSPQTLIDAIESMKTELKEMGGEISFVEEVAFSQLQKEIEGKTLTSLGALNIRLQNITTSTQGVNAAIQNASKTAGVFQKEQNKLAQKTATPYDKSIDALGGMADEYKLVDKRAEEARQAALKLGFSTGTAAGFAMREEKRLTDALNEQLNIKGLTGKSTREGFELYLKGLRESRDRLLKIKGEVKLLEVQHKKLAKAAKVVPEALAMQLDLEEEIRLKKLEAIDQAINLQKNLVQTEENRLEISEALKKLDADRLALVESKAYAGENALKIEIAEEQAAKKTLQMSQKIIANENRIVQAKQASARAAIELANLSDPRTARKTGGITPAQELRLAQEENRLAKERIESERKMKEDMAKVDYNIIRLQTELLKMQTLERLKAEKAAQQKIADTSRGPARTKALSRVGELNTVITATGDRFKELLDPETGLLVKNWRSSVAVINAEAANADVQVDVSIARAQVDFEQSIRDIATSGGGTTAEVLRNLWDGMFEDLEKKRLEAAAAVIAGGGTADEASDAANAVEPAKIDDTTTKIAMLKATMQPMVETLKSMGPEGELVAAVGQGGIAVAESFDKMFESIDDKIDSAEEFQAIAMAVGKTLSQIGNVMAAASNARIAAIDREIAAEQKRDGKSKESLAKIKGLEAKKEAMARKAFNQNKKMQMAVTVANTAAGIMGVIAAPDNVTMTQKVISGAIIAAMGAAQLAIIAGTSYQGGGGGGGADVPKSVSVGKASDRVDLGKNANAAGELAYLRGEAGRGTSAADFRPGGFAGKRYRAYGGSAYVVGEQGPELFMPEVPGQVVTNDNATAMGASTNVSFNVSAIDSTNMQDMLTSQRGNIITMIREAANSHGSGFLEQVDTSAYDEDAGGSI